MNNPTPNAPTPSEPAPGGPPSIFHTWIDALTKPNERTFAEMAASPNAKATTAYLWVFVGALIELFFSFLVQGTTMRQMLQQEGLSGNIPSSGLAGTLITLICGAPIAAVVTVIFFAIFVALVQWIAKMFGGHGTFDQLAYTFGAIAAPFYLISTVFVLLSAIPFVGFCFSIIIGLASLYVLVLEIMAVKGVNGFDWGPAIGSVLIPIFAVFLICCCLVFAASAIFGAAFSQYFQQLQQGLGTGGY